jgi:transcriptional antiterminator RfaH
VDYLSETNWYAVQAKPCREQVAADHLLAQGVETFFPELKETGRGRTVAMALVKPLFPGYFFARFRPLAQLDQVRYAIAVLRVVGTRSVPVPVDQTIIDAIRDLIKNDGYARLAPRALRPGDRVQINRGPWEGTSARFEQEWDDGRRVAILLECIHQTRVVISSRWIEPAVA